MYEYLIIGVNQTGSLSSKCLSNPKRHMIASMHVTEAASLGAPVYYARCVCAVRISLLKLALGDALLWRHSQREVIYGAPLVNVHASDRQADCSLNFS